MAKGNRKILISTLLSENQIKYLDRKIDKNDPEKKSRNAILRYLVDRAMEKALL